MGKSAWAEDHASGLVGFHARECTVNVPHTRNAHKTVVVTCVAVSELQAIPNSQAYAECVTQSDSYPFMRDAWQP